MAGTTITEVVEQIDAGKGGGGASSGNGGGREEGSGPSGSGFVPQRTYVTGMIVALGVASRPSSRRRRSRNTA